MKSGLPPTTLAANIIVSNPAILSGEPVFRGTRVPFKSLTDYLEHERSLTSACLGERNFFLPRAGASVKQFRTQDSAEKNTHTLLKKRKKMRRPQGAISRR
jgi:Protein of unknown function (DUF433)